MRNWKYLETAPNQVIAEMWRDMFIQAGIPAKLQPQDTMSFIGVSTQPVRVMVAEEQLDAAKELLAEWEAEVPEEGEDEESDDSCEEGTGEKTGESAGPQGR